MVSVPESKKEKNEWLEWTKAILFAVVIALLIRTFVFQTSIVEGESMEPTLESGQKVILNKFIYLFDKPKRGDVVIIEKSSEYYVKRVIGLPGENIEVQDNTLYIDGEEQKESYIDFNALDDTGSFDSVKIPEDSYFVMGDNRAVSMDSRNDLGFVSTSEIIGRSEFIIYPFNQWTRTK